VWFFSSEIIKYGWKISSGMKMGWGSCGKSGSWKEGGKIRRIIWEFG
jgi:hypothetical protein